jgi:hypothetical protein
MEVDGVKKSEGGRGSQYNTSENEESSSVDPKEEVRASLGLESW